MKRRRTLRERTAIFFLQILDFLSRPVPTPLYVLVFNAPDVYARGKFLMTNNGAREMTLFDAENGPLIRMEVNMEEIPLFLFKSRERVEESLESRNTIITAEGQEIRQYVKVTGGRELGLPGPADRDVYVAAMRHVHQQGGMPPDGRVSFTIYGLLRLMGKNPKAGKNQARVRESLHRIATTDIYAENAFYNMEGEVFESQRFSLPRRYPQGVGLVVVDMTSFADGAFGERTIGGTAV